MSENGIGQRTFLKGAGLAALSAVGVGRSEFDLLSDWAPSEATRHRILVENPETLYGFPKSR